MTPQYIISNQAISDLDSIWQYIASDNIDAANRVEDKILECFANLANNPLIGNLREDITTKPVRFWPIFTYHIIYKPTHPIQIIRILSGYRDISKLL
jgi:plasmid stabilization system protein ParE